MAKTKIEWADRVWNPVTGCSKFSPGCDNCYAERMHLRLEKIKGSGYDDGADHFSVRFHPERLSEPLTWKKPQRIFVCSMGDLFHVDVPFQYVDKIMNIIRQAPQHTFMILTKRAHTMREYFDQIGEIPNLWMGVTVEDQRAADERIPLLLQTPATKRFISIEPMVGPVFLRPHIGFLPTRQFAKLNSIPTIDWVILGGETGPGARPLHPDWVRSVRDQCQAVGVPFFFKQWGRKDDGRMLDGKIWEEMPAV